MSELFGPLPRHAIAGVPVGLAVAAPLVAAAIVAVLGPSLEERAARDRARPGAARAANLIVATGAAVSAIVVVTALVGALRSPSGLVVSPAWTLARTGSIDATLGFDADVGRAALALLVALGGVFVALRGDTADPARSGPRAAWRALAIGAALAALLADGLGTALLALGGALVATGAGAIRGRWAPGAAALLALSLAGATLAWGLDGRWLEGLAGNYLSDYGPRFVAARDAPPAAPRTRGPVAEPKGAITMTSAPGADVYVGVADDASLRGRTPLGTTPFIQAPVAATIQKIAIVPGAAAIIGGDGLEIALADTVDIRAGDDVVVTPVGATWTWRDLEAQLLLHDLEGKHPQLSSFAQKRIAAMAVPTAVLLLAFLAAVLAWLDGPRRIARALATGSALDASLLAATLAVATIGPVARLAVLVPLAGAGVLLALAASGVVLGALVASSRGPWLAAGAATAAAGAAMLAVAADAPPVIALGVGVLAAAAPRLAEITVRRAPHPWIAGPDEDDPAPLEPVLVVATPSTGTSEAASSEAPAAPRKKKKATKKSAEARS